MSNLTENGKWLIWDIWRIVKETIRGIVKDIRIVISDNSISIFLFLFLILFFCFVSVVFILWAVGVL